MKDIKKEVKWLWSQVVKVVRVLLTKWDSIGFLLVECLGGLGSAGYRTGIGRVSIRRMPRATGPGPTQLANGQGGLEGVGGGWFSVQARMNEGSEEEFWRAPAETLG